MMLGEEVTKELIAEFRNFATTMMYRLCGDVKTKMTKDKMKKLVMSTQCRGSICTLDELMVMIQNEELSDVDSVLAKIHIMRMNIWNENTLYSEGLKKITLETAMETDADLEKVLSGKFNHKDVRKVLGI